MKTLDQIAAALQGYDPQALPVEQVHAFLQALVTTLPATASEAVPLFEALDRVLARDVVSPIDVPAHDNSAMDGYAFNGQALARTQPIFWEHEGNRALRSGKWKIVSRENRPWELYDVEADRPESHDLASKHPRRVADMARQWEEWAARAHVLPLGAWRGTAAASTLVANSNASSDIGCTGLSPSCWRFAASEGAAASHS